MKALLRALFTWPLLHKSLLEQASVRRTYVIRALFAFGIYAYILYELLQGNLPIGRGGYLARQYFGLLIYFALLSLPFFCGASISREKADETLELLRVSGMHPMAFVFQKWIGSLVPFVIFFVLSSPILVLAYLLGGVEIQALLAISSLYLVLVLTTSAFCIACSAWANHVVSGVLWSLLGTGLWFFITGFTAGELSELPIAHLFYTDLGSLAFFGLSPIEDAYYMLFRVSSLEELFAEFWKRASIVYPVQLAFAFVFLVIASRVAWSRSGTSHRNLTLALHGGLDRTFLRWERFLFRKRRTVTDSPPFFKDPLVQAAMRRRGIRSGGHFFRYHLVWLIVLSISWPAILMVQSETLYGMLISPVGVMGMVVSLLLIRSLMTIKRSEQAQLMRVADIPSEKIAQAEWRVTGYLVLGPMILLALIFLGTVIGFGDPLEMNRLEIMEQILIFLVSFLLPFILARVAMVCACHGRSLAWVIGLWYVLVLISAFSFSKIYDWIADALDNIDWLSWAEQQRMETCIWAALLLSLWILLYFISRAAAKRFYAA